MLDTGFDYTLDTPMIRKHEVSVRHQQFKGWFVPHFILRKAPTMEFATALQVLTDDVGIYISARLRYILLNKGGNEFPPKEISDSLVVDCEQVISVIVEAWRADPIQVDWDIEEYVKDIGTQPTGIFLFDSGLWRIHGLNCQGESCYWKRHCSEDILRPFRQMTRS